MASFLEVKMKEVIEVQSKAEYISIIRSYCAANYSNDTIVSLLFDVMADKHRIATDSESDPLELLTFEACEKMIISQGLDMAYKRIAELEEKLEKMASVIDIMNSVDDGK